MNGLQLELCKMLKFDHANEWYMYKPKPVQENETCKILRDNQITKSQAEQKLMKKKILSSSDFC